MPTSVPPGSTPLVGIVMGSASDLPTMRKAADALTALEIPCEISVCSAHRNTLAAIEYGRSARARGLKVLIAGAGGAAHLPGVLAAVTVLPVIGVPIGLKNLDGLDSLLSIAQMPSGVPVATVSIDGAANAGLLAARILGSADPAIAELLVTHAEALIQTSLEQDAKVAAELGQV